MEEVKKLYLDDERDQYVYAPERFWHLEKCEPETLYVFKEDELDPQGKLYLNMLRIIKDRSLQQIDKSKADEHGYRTLDVVEKKEFFIIRKATPYSIKMDIGVVAALIKSDLEEYYNGIFDNVRYTVNNGMRIFETEVMFRDIEQMNKYRRESLERKKEEGYPKEGAFLKYIDEKGIELGAPLVEGIEKIHANIGNGYYEVIYKATGII